MGNDGRYAASARPISAGIHTGSSGVNVPVHRHRERDRSQRGNTQTADLVGSVTKVGAIGADGVYYDPAAWAQPVGVRFGDTRINQFRGPGGWNLDLSVFRTFPLARRHRLELRIEANNVTDTPKFGHPNQLDYQRLMRISASTRSRSGRSVSLRSIS